MNLFEKIANELDKLPKPAMSREEAEFAYEYMDQFDTSDHTSSWAIWNPNKAKDSKFVKENKHLINTKYMLLGMNQSDVVPKNGIFHFEACSNALAQAFLKGPLKKFYGAYIMDLLNITGEDGKVFQESDSSKVIKFLKTTKGKNSLKRAKEIFKTRLKALTELNDGKKPTIIAMGDLVVKYVNLWAPGHKIISIPHPAQYGGHQKYNATAALWMSDRDVDSLDPEHKDYFKNEDLIKNIKSINFIDLNKKIDFYINQMSNKKHNPNFSGKKDYYEELMRKAKEEKEILNDLKPGIPLFIKEKSYKTLETINNIAVKFNEKSFPDQLYAKENLEQSFNKFLNE